MKQQKKKILFIATTGIHINNFHIPYIQLLQEKGYEVHVVCTVNQEVKQADLVIDVPIARSPFNKVNYKAYTSIKQLIETHQYVLVHGHTPMGGVLARLCVLFAKTKHTKVVYTAHGFHFYKGSSKLNWLLYYPIERTLSRFTDCLITINQEDHTFVKRKFPKSLQHFRIHGIGVNPDRLVNMSEEAKQEFRASLGIPKGALVFLYIAEFSVGKRHLWLLPKVKTLLNQNPNLVFLFAGGGNRKALIEKEAETMGIGERLKFLGYRNDIKEIIGVIDVGVSASNREGLPIGIAEICSSGKPVIVTDIRGHNELVDHGENGFKVTLEDSEEKFVSYATQLIQEDELRKRMGEKSTKKLKKYQLQATLNEMNDVYEALLPNYETNN